MTDINPVAVGAVNIAKAVGIKPWHVYNLKRNGKAPIHNREGIGLVADPAELKAWLLGKHRESTAP